MTRLRFDIALPEGVSEEDAEAAAEVFCKKMLEIPEIEDPEAEVIGADRDIGSIIQTLAVAATALVGAAQNYNTLMDAIDKTLKFWKSKPDPSPAEKVLALLEPKDVVIRIGRRLVPLAALTKDDLDELARAS